MSSNPFSLEALIQSVQSDKYFIPVTEDQLRFVANQNLVTVKKIHSNMSPNESGEWGINLPRKYELSLAETLAIRKDRYLEAERKEIVAAIGDFKNCDKKKAESILSDNEQWETLPEEIQEKIDTFLLKLGEDKPEMHNARLITAIIQSRWIKNWRLEETLALPASLFEKFIEYMNSEREGKKAKTQTIAPSQTMIGSQYIVEKQSHSEQSLNGNQSGLTSSTGAYTQPPQ